MSKGGNWISVVNVYGVERRKIYVLQLMYNQSKDSFSYESITKEELPKQHGKYETEKRIAKLQAKGFLKMKKVDKLVDEFNNRKYDVKMKKRSKQYDEDYYRLQARMIDARDELLSM